MTLDLFICARDSNLLQKVNQIFCGRLKTLAAFFNAAQRRAAALAPVSPPPPPPPLPVRLESVRR